MKKPTKPTRRQLRIVDWIIAYIQRESRTPTAMEVGRGFKISGAAAFTDIGVLKQKGYLRQDPNTWRPCYEPAPVCPNCGGRLWFDPPKRRQGQ